MPRRTSSVTPGGGRSCRGNSASTRRPACATPTHSPSAASAAAAVAQLGGVKRRSGSAVCGGPQSRYFFNAASVVQYKHEKTGKNAGYAAPTFSSASHQGTVPLNISNSGIATRRRSSIQPANAPASRQDSIGATKRPKKKRSNTGLGASLNSSGKVPRNGLRLLGESSPYEITGRTKEVVPVVVPVQRSAAPVAAHHDVQVKPYDRESLDDSCASTAATAPQDEAAKLAAAPPTPSPARSWRVLRFSSDVVVGENGQEGELNYDDDSDIDASSTSSDEADDPAADYPEAYPYPDEEEGAPSSPLVFRAPKKVGTGMSGQPPLREAQAPEPAESPTTTGSGRGTGFEDESDAQALPSDEESSTTSEEADEGPSMISPRTPAAWVGRDATSLAAAMALKQPAMPAIASGPLPTTKYIKHPVVAPLQGVPSTPPKELAVHDVLFSGVEEHFFLPRWPPHTVVMRGQRERNLTGVHPSPQTSPARRSGSPPPLSSPSSSTSPTHSAPRARGSRTSRKTFPLLAEAMSDYTTYQKKKKRITRGYCYEDVMFFKLQAPYMEKKGRRARRTRNRDSPKCQMTPLQALQFGFSGFQTTEPSPNVTKSKTLLLQLSMPLRGLDRHGSSGNGFVIPPNSPRIFLPRTSLKRSNSSGSCGPSAMSMRSRYDNSMNPMFAHVHGSTLRV